MHGHGTPCCHGKPPALAFANIPRQGRDSVQESSKAPMKGPPLDPVVLRSHDSSSVQWQWHPHPHDASHWHTKTTLPWFYLALTSDLGPRPALPGRERKETAPLSFCASCELRAVDRLVSLCKFTIVARWFCPRAPRCLAGCCEWRVLAIETNSVL